MIRKDEVTAAKIGEIVMKRLKKVDEVAYIRFASVYQGFKDAAEFHEAVEQLFKKPKNKLRASLKKRGSKKSKKK